MAAREPTKPPPMITTTDFVDSSIGAPDDPLVHLMVVCRVLGKSIHGYDHIRQLSHKIMTTAATPLVGSHTITQYIPSIDDSPSRVVAIMGLYVFHACYYCTWTRAQGNGRGRSAPESKTATVNQPK